MDIKPRAVELPAGQLEITPPKLAQVYEVKPQGFKRGGGSNKRRPVPRPAAPSEPPFPETHVPIVFVTSFSPEGYRDYGKRFLEGFIRHWPKDVILAVFYERDRPAEEDDRIWYFNLLDDLEMADWFLRYGQDRQAQGFVKAPDGREVYDFRYAAARFAPKVFALTSPVLPSSTFRVWIDADVETTGQIPETYFSKLLRDDKATAFYLGRPRQVFATSECGFVAYRVGHPSGRQFLLDLRLNYTSGAIFKMPEWHDSFVFDALRAAYEQLGCTFKNLAADYYAKLLPHEMSFEQHGHPWPNTKLGEHLVHHKGPRGKENAIAAERAKPQHVDLMRLLADKSIMNRYQQIGRILSVLPHKTIVEVGVARGETGLAMCSINLRRGKPVEYIGFDLFEGLTEELAAEELNGKKVLTHAEVEEKFAALAAEYPGLLTFRLIKGNTRETLPGFKWPDDGVDFAFIDGGHSVETIASDYAALQDNAGMIVFDDYYLAGQDTSKFGCNRVVDGIKPRMLLPVVDRLGNGTEIQLAVVGPALTRPGQQQEIKIKTKNCVADDVIQANVRNTARYTDHGLKVHVKKLQVEFAADPAGLLVAMKDLDPGFRAKVLPGVLKPVSDPVLFVGGSPSVTDPAAPGYAENWAKIREMAATHHVVVCKTSYAVAFKEGVVPWACFLLDPRDHVAEWLNPPDCRVLWLVASMCHPSTWEHIARPGFKAFIYHAGVGAQEQPVMAEYFENAAVVHGGTTSSFRGISLLYNLGYRNFTTIGLDSSYPTKPEKPHGRSPKPVQQVTVGEQTGMARQFWTDPELIAQSQDAEMLAKIHPSLRLEYLGDGLLQHARRVYDEMVRRADPLDRRPVEHRLNAWFNAFRLGQPLPEALYVAEAARALDARAAALQARLDQEPTFEEVTS